MAQSRVVIDNSVLVPAFLGDEHQYGGNWRDLSRLAIPVIDAVRLHRVRTFAPEQLQIEFLRVVRERCLSRQRTEHLSLEAGDTALASFHALPIRYIPAQQLLPAAARLALRCGISADDSWYVAAAMAARAELWMSHDHSDGLAEAARRQGVTVRLLVHDRIQ